MRRSAAAGPTRRRDVVDVFLAFLALGSTSFGGPIAHLGYLHREFVQRRAWLDDATYAQVLAICQFLPGPTSSQMGFAIGLLRAGTGGALAAFVAFTLPSALLLFAFAVLAPAIEPGWLAALLHGLTLVAVIVVAHGVIDMARRLLPDLRRYGVAAAALVAVLWIDTPWATPMAIGVGGLLGIALCRDAVLADSTAVPTRGGRAGAGFALGAFLVLLLLALITPMHGEPGLVAIAATFYKAGSLVFGGGHVVLPLLEHAVVGERWMPVDEFLAGYGAAQAVPGPLFSVAAFLGAKIPLAAPSVSGALVALAAVFLPGFLLLLAVLPAWGRLSRWPWAARVIAGTNAAVVGVLGAAFCDPIWSHGIGSVVDLAIATAGFAALATRRVSMPWIVLACVAITLAIHAVST